MPLTVAVMMLALGQAGPVCRYPPSRASDAYWPYIEACGCDSLAAPSPASDDYERFMKACSAWRERNPEVTVAVPAASPSPDTGGVVVLADPPRIPAECLQPPSRVSDRYWTYIDACGCARIEPPSRASSDFDRFWKACGDWRRRNPVTVLTASPSPAASPAPRPSPRPSARPSPPR